MAATGSAEGAVRRASDGICSLAERVRSAGQDRETPCFDAVLNRWAPQHPSANQFQVPMSLA